jgi:phosphatidylethanolamine/phosphatidyl-N-methylethanolamine N-methyltransferase
MMQTNTDQIKQRYNRIAAIYDAMEGVLELVFFRRWRELVWAKVEGQEILEVGVGTGKNFPYYPQGAKITAIDFSEKMLGKAQQKKLSKGVNVDLQLMDVQALEFPNNSFDTVVATFVFCSVPDPRQGIKELYRVCKPGGKVILLEHVLSSNRCLAKVMNLLNPLVVRMVGANINRETVEVVCESGFRAVQADPVSGDIVKLMTAIK